MYGSAAPNETSAGSGEWSLGKRGRKPKRRLDRRGPGADVYARRGSASCSIPYIVRTSPAAVTSRASAGNAKIHQEPVRSASWTCAAASSEPQVEPSVSPSANRPRESDARKSSVARVTIAWIAMKNAPAAMRPAMFGMNSNTTTRVRLSPIAIAPATKSVLRSESAWARSTRASAAQHPRPIISMVATAV